MPLQLTEPIPADEALRIASERGLLPTALDTEGIRARLGPALRARSVFSATVAEAAFLSGVKRAVEAILAAESDRATMRLALKRLLQTLGYTPEGGFPAVPEGQVPPAVEGAIKDLSSDRRLDLILETQVDLMRGAGQKERGEAAERLRLFPFWELVRAEPREAPRDWFDRWARTGEGEPPGGRLAAPKGADVWLALGSSDLFDDALDTDHPPFAFNSGMRWRELSRAEGEALGMRAEDAAPAPTGQPFPGRLPKPAASTLAIDPEVLQGLKGALSAIEADGKIEYNDVLETELDRARRSPQP